MKIDSHGTKQTNGEINPLITFLEKAEDNQKWNFMGLTVEIDPTADHHFQNVLIRWTDILEGFNDRVIVKDLKEFNFNFTKINHD